MPSSNTRRTLGPTGRTLQPRGRVGFDTLPDQVVNRELKKGFAFNVLCVGDTGIGKSTIIDSLFKRKFENEEHEHENKATTVEVEENDIEDAGINLHLTVISTKNFGDTLDRSQSHEEVVKYIDAQFEKYLQEELRTQRDMSKVVDTRVHVCLYFLPPTGHSLRSVDLECIRKLEQKVNVVPLIAKADTITKQELKEFKKILVQEFERHQLSLYEPEQDSGAVDCQALIPFAVIGSRDEIVVGGERIRVRQYPWGVVEVENEEHSDFLRLREMLLRTHMSRLMRRTHVQLYERYRKSKLQQLGYLDADPSSESISLRETFEQKRKDLLAEIAKKEEEMRQVFVAKVKRKEAELKAAEAELTSKFEKLRKIHLEEQKDLQTQVAILEAERAEWMANEQKEAEEFLAKNKKKDKKKH